MAGTLAGLAAAYSVLVVIVARGKPDPERLLRAGRPLEAYRQLKYEVSFTRRLAAKRPMFRDVLAGNLETMSQVLQALDNEPLALEAATEAAAIYTELAARRPGSYRGALARTLLQQAALLARMGHHGEALAAVEPAVQNYRSLAVSNRNTYLPCLAAALTRQADELSYLDRITEARTAAAEAELIRTDMLVSPHSQEGSPATGAPP